MIAMCAVLLGSSPLTRGKPHASRSPRDRRRLIPAHAGKTAAGHESPLDARAHPRSRGENCEPLAPLLHRDGSSPLTRGKQPRGSSRRGGGWLIPAHAGKTPLLTRSSRTARAHPRSRGENAIVIGMVREGMGSSPLTRGKPSWSKRPTPTARLIPAHAGKTRRPRRRGKSRWAHPRSRGENEYLKRGSFISPGSSPLTRGKLLRSIVQQGVQGLIPAHAGKTSNQPGSGGATGGSSPLTRGKQRIRPARLSRAGLIPAHAGKTT